jgi:hypothetical protein
MQRIDAVFLEPFVGLEKEVLLAPEHPGQCLSHYISGVFADAGGSYRPVKIVCLAPALLDEVIELASERAAGASIAQPEPNDSGRACTYLQLVMRGSFGPSEVRMDGLPPPRHNIIVDPVIDVGRRIGRAKDPLVVGVVFGEQ